jgi:glycolate oxidase FAD binding subunit
MIAEKREARVIHDWSGGLIWLATDEDADGGAATIRAAAASVGGHSTLVRASDALRSRVAVFEPVPAALKAVTAGIKCDLDPHNLFNPGLMDAA